MLLKTLLNHCEHFKCFVYQEVRWADPETKMELEVIIKPRANSHAICSKCGLPAPGYDCLEERRFHYVPLWNIPVFFLYIMRRVSCPRCGVKVEQVPWCDGNNSLTTTYRWFLAAWAKRLSWKTVAEAFGEKWQNVFRSVQYAVSWGLAHRSLEGIEAIGVDEVLWRKGYQFLTLVYQIDNGCRRLLWIGENRTTRTLLRFFRMMGKERSSCLKFVCSDMWKPYLKVIAKKAGASIHVLDRFHIVQRMGKAIDEIRAGEARRLKAEGYAEVLKHSRWCLLKRPENLTDQQTVRLAELLKYNIRTVRGYLLKEDFQRFWNYIAPSWAGKFLDEWCNRTMQSKLEPMKKVARMLRRHRPLILNWFRAKGQISVGAVEGFNNKVKLTTRKAFGYRTFGGIQVALYHVLGNLPEPNFTHRFW